VDEKIIEKAAIKLKLDKLVIQQGRLTDNNQKLKNEDMLQWIRYGANFAFSDAGLEMISDETIESILTKSKSKSEEADSKIDKFGEESLRNFTLDTEDSLHIFEGEDYRDKSKKMMEWIEPPKRERKVTVYSDKMFSGHDNKEDKDFVPKVFFFIFLWLFY
jgi:SWI/SNF-related matrix-associated actin-dependent regulator of chromatin subfamily A member 5